MPHAPTTTRTIAAALLLTLTAAHTTTRANTDDATPKQQLEHALKRVADASYLEYKIMTQGTGEVASEVDWFSGIVSYRRAPDARDQYRIDGYWITPNMPHWGVRSGILADDGQKLRFHYKHAAFLDQSTSHALEGDSDAQSADETRAAWLWLAIPNWIRKPDSILPDDAVVTHAGTTHIQGQPCILLEVRNPSSIFWSRYALHKETHAIVRLEAMIPPPAVESGGAIVHTFLSIGPTPETLGIDLDPDRTPGWWEPTNTTDWFAPTPPPNATQVQALSQSERAAQAAERSAVTVGAPAPDWTLTDSKGNPVQLSSLRGKTVVLDFWATWCAPCLKALPDLTALQTKHQSNLAVLSITTDTPDPQHVINRFESSGGAHTLLLEGEQLAQEWGITALPTCIIIDPHGTVTARHTGWSDDALQRIEQEIIKAQD
jgi:thiol-disulfide isomerase/thioredoxin